MAATNWFVITGAPSSGKTTLLNHLEKTGCRTVAEVARGLIDSDMKKGMTLEEIRADEARFEHRILATKVSIEKSLPQKEVIFFDRAIPDSMAYFILAGLDVQEVMIKCQRDHYKAVFLLDPLPLKKDPIRREALETAERLDHLLEKSYHMLGYPVQRVPVMPEEERLAMVLAKTTEALQGLG